MLDRDLEATRGKTERLRRGLEANAAGKRREALERLAPARERLAHMPKQLGMVNDLSPTPKGDPRVRVILKWNDGYENVVYVVAGTTRLSEIKPLSDRIRVQGGALNQLSPEEQSRIRGEFSSSNGAAASIQPYNDFLQNEALGKRFEELKQNPPRPFDNK